MKRIIVIISAAVAAAPSNSTPYIWVDSYVPQVKTEILRSYPDMTKCAPASACVATEPKLTIAITSPGSQPVRVIGQTLRLTLYHGDGSTGSTAPCAPGTILGDAVYLTCDVPKWMQNDRTKVLGLYINSHMGSSGTLAEVAEWESTDPEERRASIEKWRESGQLKLVVTRRLPYKGEATIGGKTATFTGTTPLLQETITGTVQQTMTAPSSVAAKCTVGIRCDTPIRVETASNVVGHSYTLTTAVVGKDGVPTTVTVPTAARLSTDDHGRSSHDVVVSHSSKQAGDATITVRLTTTIY